MSPRHSGSAPASLDLDGVGERIRDHRKQVGIGVRELARRLNVSASLISQIEMGKTKPSVQTLYRIVNELGVSLDDVFGLDATEGAVAGASPHSQDVVPKEQPAPVDLPARPSGAAEQTPLPSGPVQRKANRPKISLASGVTWERLTATPDAFVDFLWVVYEVGSASSDVDGLMVHTGREYGVVISGRLAVTVGFDTFEIGPGDSISFDSSTPHRLACVGNEPAHAVWIVIGRMGDLRSLGLH